MKSDAGTVRGSDMERGLSMFVGDLRGAGALKTVVAGFFDEYGRALGALPAGPPSAAMKAWLAQLARWRRGSMFRGSTGALRFLQAPWLFPAVCARILPPTAAAEVAESFRAAPKPSPRGSEKGGDE